MFLDNPFLGVGPKLFRVKCKDEKYAVGTLPCSTHPHNFYVQLLGETGLAGFLFILSALFFLIYKVLQSFIHKLTNKKKLILSDYQICLISALFVTLWPLSPNGNFFNNFLMIVYALPVGFLKKGKLKF
jgi:O-antigen ligase